MTVRVAIYTRKSTEKGLDQKFNSLDAQREAAEAYCQSQAGKGWEAIPNRYDDGGFSGATTNRPALKRLLADIEQGQIDAVAVYRLDRISRSQLNLLQLLQLFEEKNVRFVSITEDFNTSTPMGRFALSILSAIAQLEREQIAARVRDKAHATRRRGQWTGGHAPLGYDVQDKCLVVNEQEADQVRTIFDLYVEFRSLSAVAETLNQHRWKTKTHRKWDKLAVRRILSNPTFLGEVHFNGSAHEGQHDAIVDQETFDKIQGLLANGTRPTKSKNHALLAGQLWCGVCGSRMTPTRSRQYLYYTCTKLQREGAKACPGSRVSARKIEGFVVDQIKAIGQDPELVRETIKAAKDPAPEIKKLDRERQRLAREKENLLDAIQEAGAPVAERLAEVDRELQRVEAAKSELAPVVDVEELKTALEEFTPLWQVLYPQERVRIMELLVSKVTYDSVSGEVEVELR